MLHSFLDQLSVGLYQYVFVVDYNEDKVIYVPQGVENIFGMKRNELSELSLSNLYSMFRLPEENQKIRSLKPHFEQLFRQFNIYNFIISFNLHIVSKKSGDIHLMHNKLFPFELSNDGKVT